MRVNGKGAWLFGLLVSLFWLAVQVPGAQAQFRLFCPPGCRPAEPCPDISKPPTVIPKDKPPEPSPAPITTAALGDAVSVPNMMGDFGGYCAFRTISIDHFKVVTQSSGPPIVVPIKQNVTVCDPVAVRAGSGFKIGDNESPKPQDRVFFTYNYFSNLQGQGGVSPAMVIPDVDQFGVPTTANIPPALVPGRAVNVHRELFGFEKTFLGGDASFALRVPIFQTNGGGPTFAGNGFTGDGIGDITAILKFALLNDNITGNVLSLGLAVTAPTGPDIITTNGQVHPTLIQPYTGYIVRLGDLYFQGFHSLVVPTSSQDSTLFFNDLGIGYIFRGRGPVAFVAPNFEVHVTTPLEHGTAFIIPDIVALTAGAHIGLGDGRTVLSLGVANPITGPRPYDIEAFGQFNFRF